MRLAHSGSKRIERADWMSRPLPARMVPESTAEATGAISPQLRLTGVVSPKAVDCREPSGRVSLRSLRTAEAPLSEARRAGGRIRFEFDAAGQ